MLRLPAQPKDLTRDWVAHVLDAPVTSVTLSDAHSGTTGRAVIELEYAEPMALPARLFVKLPPTDELQRAFVTSSGMGRRESLFYDSLSAEVPLRVPHCYFSACDDSGEEYVMLLEHLEDSGCTFKNASTRYSLDYIRSVLTTFARLHSAYWMTPRFDTDLSWLEPPVQHDIAVGLVERALQTYADDMPVVFRDMAELYLSETDAVHQLWRRGDTTLIHGDVHDGNLFIAGDEPGFLDWALAARAPGMRDVGYFLAGTLTPQDQSRHGREMLGWYRDQLLANGAPAPTLDALWQQYQWHAAYVWLGAAVTLAMGDAWQPVKYVKGSFRRLHPALEQLGSVAAIRSAL